MADKRMTSPGLRADRPLTVEEDIDVTSGPHSVQISVLGFDGTVRFERGRVVLVTYEGDRLVVR